jgi:hypothetical protein
MQAGLVPVSDERLHGSPRPPAEVPREEEAHFGTLLLSPFCEVVGIQEGVQGRRHGSDGGEVAVVWAAARGCVARA